MEIGSSGGIRIGSSQPQETKPIKEGKNNKKVMKNQFLSLKSGMQLSYGVGTQVLVRYQIIYYLRYSCIS